MRVSEPATTCGCVRSGISFREIAPGASATLTAEIPEISEQSSLNQHVMLYINGTPAEPLVFPVKGVRILRLQTSPRAVNLGLCSSAANLTSDFWVEVRHRKTEEGQFAADLPVTESDFDLVPTGMRESFTQDGIVCHRTQYRICWRSGQGDPTVGAGKSFVDVAVGGEKYRMPISWQWAAQSRYRQPRLHLLSRPETKRRRRPLSRQRFFTMSCPSRNRRSSATQSMAGDP